MEGGGGGVNTAQVTNTSSLITLHDVFNIADPNRTQNACIYEFLLGYGLACQSLVVRASDWCMESQRFNFCWGLRFFSLTHDLLKVSIASFRNSCKFFKIPT